MLYFYWFVWYRQTFLWFCPHCLCTYSMHCVTYLTQFLLMFSVCIKTLISTVVSVIILDSVLSWSDPLIRTLYRCWTTSRLKNKRTLKQRYDTQTAGQEYLRTWNFNTKFRNNHLARWIKDTLYIPGISILLVFSDHMLHRQKSV